MILIRNLVLFYSILFLVSSCQEPMNDFPTRDIYIPLMENILLSCDSVGLNNYVDLELNDDHFCAGDGFNNIILDFNVVTTFTTTSTTISTNDSTGFTDKFPRLIFRQSDWFIDGDVYFEMNFPSLSGIEASAEKYFDSLLLISNHNIRSIDSLNSDFSVILQLYSSIQSDSGLLFPIASYFGEQEKNTLEIMSFSKEVSGDFLLYDIELKFSCDLFHDPIYRFSPNLWKSIDDGLLKFSFTIPK